MDKNFILKIKPIVGRLEKLCSPVSIFLYGSWAKGDFTKKSDIEIGVLMLKKNYISRSQIESSLKSGGIKVYPFIYEDFMKLNIDTPFQKALYLRDLIASGKILYGENVFKKLKAPSIRVLDLIQEVRFNLGYVLSAVHSYRNGDRQLASYLFSKSCLYGTRCLEILQMKRFPLTFSAIHSLSKKLKLGEYKFLITEAYKMRTKQISTKNSYYLFKNISYLNGIVEPRLLDFYKKHGNRVLVK